MRRSSFRRNFILASVGVVAGAAFGIGTHLLTPQSFTPAARGTLAHWEERFSSPLRNAEQTARGLARTAQPTCLVDRLQTDILRQDIASLEGKWTGPAGRGLWSGMDKSRLHPAEAAFLSVDDGKWLISDDIDFSGCQDIICILKRAYRDKDDERALKTYWWFLNTGSVLAVSPGSPVAWVEEPEARRAAAEGKLTFQEKRAYFTGTTPEDYFFKNEDLNGLWLTAFKLPPKFRGLPTLRSLHKTPANHLFPGWDYSLTANPPGWIPEICANAGGEKTDGMIRFHGACIRIYKVGVGELPWDSRYYSAIVHEMTHRLDHHLGKDGYETGLPPFSTYFSGSAEWLDLSGWNYSEYFDTEKKKNVTGWRFDKKKAGFISNYAVSSPVEDFAETVAHLLFPPEPNLLLTGPQTDEQQATLEEKLQLVRQRILEGRNYSATGLIQFIQAKATERVRDQLLPMVNSCLTERDSVVRTGSGHFRLSVPDVVKDRVRLCLEEELERSIRAAFGRLRAEEVDACTALTQETTPPALKAVAANLTLDIEKLVSTQKEVEAILLASRALRDALAEELDPREAWLHCHRKEDAEACYQAALTTAFEQVSGRFSAELGDRLEAERAGYLSSNTFESAKARTLERFRQLFAPVEDRVREAAGLRWSKCLPYPDSSVHDPLLKPFSGGALYVDGGILNCVNGSANSDVELAVSEFSEGHGIDLSNPNARSLLMEQLLGAYLVKLNEHLKSDSEKEGLELATLAMGRVAKLRDKLLGDQSWALELAFPKDLRKACVTRAEQRFDSEGVPYRFTALEDTRLTWASKACEMALADPTLSEAVKAARDRYHEDLQKEVHILFAAIADSFAAACKAKSPGNQLMERLRRDRCLRSQWSDIEGETARRWRAARAPEVTADDEKAVLTWLARQRKALEDEAVQRMNR